MSLTYTTYVNQLSNLVVIPSTDTNFTTFLPGCIDYAEQRIYRECNFIATQVRDASAALTPNTRNFTLPSALGTFISVQDINIITPAGATAINATRNSLTPCSLQMMDFLFQQESAPTTPSVPQMFAIVDNSNIVVGPSPDAAYLVEVIGTIRPTPLSSTNTNTYLTQYLPDLFMAASLVFAFGYQRDFGGQADNVQAGSAWEAQYQKLLASAQTEEIRKKYNETFSAKLTEPPTTGGPV